MRFWVTHVCKSCCHVANTLNLEVNSWLWCSKPAGISAFMLCINVWETHEKGQ